MRNGIDAAENGRKRSGHDGAGTHRSARPRADVHHPAGAASPLRRSTTPISATATGCAGSALIWWCCSTTVSSWPSCFLISGTVRPRQPGAKGTGDLPARPCVAARRTVSGVGPGADADRVLSDIPALSSAGNDGFQLPAFLVAHAHDRAMAFRSGMVSVGAAGARRSGRRGLVRRASDHPGVRPAHFFRRAPADGGLRRISDRLDRSLSAAASGVR